MNTEQTSKIFLRILIVLIYIIDNIDQVRICVIAIIWKQINQQYDYERHFYIIKTFFVNLL